MLDRRVLPILATAIPLICLALWTHVVADTTAWIGTFEWVVSGGVVLAGVGTAIATWRGVRWLGIAVSAALLVANTAFVAGTLFGWHPVAMLAGTSSKFAVVLSAGTMFGVVGLVMRRQWARWLCLALGVAGLGCGTLNAINFWSVSGTPNAIDVAWYHDVLRSEWAYLVNAVGGALIVVNLVAARGSFIASPMWSRPDPVMRWLRLSVITSFLAVPMLLVYAWMQPIVPATQPTALALAAAITVGAVLAVRGKLIGALLLVATGCGLLAQTIVTVIEAGPLREIAGYYAVFWVPAAVPAIVCGILMARPTLRLLRA